MADLNEDATTIHYPNVVDVYKGISSEYLDHGNQSVMCPSCNALLLKAEVNRPSSSNEEGAFSLSCYNGKVELPDVRQPDDTYLELFHGETAMSKYFLKNIRRFNSMFSFTSLGGKIDHSINRGNAPYTFRLSVENYHCLGSLLPLQGCKPLFSQLYIYDTENEVSNRQVFLGNYFRPFSSTFVIDNNSLDDELEMHIINYLKTMLDSNNHLVQAYRMVRDCFEENPQLDLKLRIIGPRQHDAEQYNLPSSSEVAALIVGDIGDAVDNRDIIVTKQSGSIKRISELHPSYTPLQYPLFHPFGEDGYQVNILHKNVSSSSTAARKKVKLDALIKLVKDKSLFGKVQAVVYTIEFQKRGLPHAHICIFMHPSSKIHNPQDVDKFISAEIPNKDTDPDLYKLVSDHMIHGPCGDANLNCTCMVNKKCSKGFPKMFNDGTTVDSQGFPVYKRRDNGQYVVKSDIMMDNRTVVPYNKTLLKQFQAHINVEWFNQDRSIKYMFKYINKGPNRATISLAQNNNVDNPDPNLDEIKAFYDCRYVSACEATWRIFSFDVHYRISSVMRLAFHLPGEQQVIYSANKDIEDILNKTTNASSMFTGWFECTKNHDLAKTLTYAEFPTKYVWKKQLRKWEPRLRGFAIGKVHVVPPAFDEAYYLRILLNKVRGPECFEDIRTVDGVVCETFQDSCYKRGLLDDDKEYIEATEEASHTYIWESSWQLLVDGM
ncbi:uncharacterized protein LOC143533132 [Bidens hawaiensis]|uniref:uncharacterized protein LOC143533132 n=1 Tax=Bidens hawaiensis TaxID=980011 RepID=UPI0040492334